MTVHADQADFPVSLDRPTKRSLRRAVPFLVGPVIVYAVVRPLVSTDALALGIAGEIPILYNIVLAVARRRVDLVALITGVGFAAACVVSVLTGASSLPLKLHEALITFGVGLVLLIAALICRPLPTGRLLRIPATSEHNDMLLGVIVGGFLLLHALLHVALAVTLSTSSYVVTSRLVNWGTIAFGVLGLAAYRRHLREQR